MRMNLSRSIGWPASPSGAPDRRLIQYINLKLASIGCPTFGGTEESELAEFASALLVHQRETDRLLANYLCPADNRIQGFLYEYLQDVAAPLHSDRVTHLPQFLPICTISVRSLGTIAGNQPGRSTGDDLH